MQFVKKVSKCVWFVLIVLGQACNIQDTVHDREMVITSVEGAEKLIDTYKGRPEDFVLPITQQSEITLRGNNVPRDLAMAIILDKILKKGWSPNGYRDKGKVRYYKFQSPQHSL